MPTHKIIIVGNGCLAAACTQLTIEPHPTHPSYASVSIEVQRPNITCGYASAKGAFTEQDLDAFLGRLHAAMREPEGPYPESTGVGSVSVSIYWRGQHIQQQIDGRDGIVRVAALVLSLLPGFGLTVDDSLSPIAGQR